MGFGGGHYGWCNDEFELYDVDFRCSVSLQELYDGNWVDRKASDILQILANTDDKKNKIIYEFENPKAIRYGDKKRALKAKARCGDDSRNTIILGVPEEEKQEVGIGFFDFVLIESDISDLNNMVRFGSFRYFKGNPEFSIESGVEAVFFAPSNVFDDIENIFLIQNIKLVVSINKKGWRSVGPMANAFIYFDINNPELAEFSGITYIKEFENEVSHEDKFSESEREDDPADALKVNLRLLSKLTDFGVYVASINYAVWLIAFGVIFLAINGL